MKGYISEATAVYGWVEVDLGQAYDVVEVMIHRVVGREQHKINFVNYEVRVGHEKTFSYVTYQRLLHNTLCGYTPTDPFPDPYFVVVCTSPTNGRYVSVQNMQNDVNSPLVVDEIKVKIRDTDRKQRRFVINHLVTHQASLQQLWNHL